MSSIITKAKELQQQQLEVTSKLRKEITLRDRNGYLLRGVNLIARIDVTSKDPMVVLQRVGVGEDSEAICIDFPAACLLAQWILELRDA